MVSLVAHRGFAGLHAENTVPAVRAAAGRADAVEVDVRRCADDLVCCHDATIDRVTRETGPVADRTAAELGEVSVFDGPAGVPCLADVVAAVPADAGLVLEVKERAVAEETAELAADAPQDVTLSAFDPAALATAREVAPEVDRALLVAETPERAVGRAVDLDCAAVHAARDLCLRSRVVPLAREAGLDVAAWTVHSDLAATLVAGRGVDALIADRPVTTWTP